jgi:hypothetical protein
MTVVVPRVKASRPKAIKDCADSQFEQPSAICYLGSSPLRSRMDAASPFIEVPTVILRFWFDCQNWLLPVPSLNRVL